MPLSAIISYDKKSRDNDGYIDFREFLIATNLSVSYFSYLWNSSTFILNNKFAIICEKNNVNSVNVYARFPFVEVLAIGNLNQFPQGGPLLSGNTGRIIIPRLWF